MKKVMRPAILKGRHTAPEFILCAVRWYLRYSLSLRDVEDLLTERGTDHAPIYGSAIPDIKKEVLSFS